MIISFAWTTEALLQGRKTVTRRFWTDKYARRFRKGILVNAYNRSPRRGGKKVATIRLTRDAYIESLYNMPDDHFEREGGTLHWKHKDDFIEAMLAQGKETMVWVVEFEVVSVVADIPLFEKEKK